MIIIAIITHYIDHHTSWQFFFTIFLKAMALELLVTHIKDIISFLITWPLPVVLGFSLP